MLRKLKFLDPYLFAMLLLWMFLATKTDWTPDPKVPRSNLMISSQFCGDFIDGVNKVSIMIKIDHFGAVIDDFWKKQISTIYNW